MKLFLSYGHEAINRPIADLIEAALRTRHDVWIDRTEIKTGDHWRRTILDGLRDTHYTVGVLSKHAVRDGGVCLNELAIALNHKGGAILTILIEPEEDVRPPVSIGHIQWLDMQDWRARMDAGTAVFQPWFDAKMADLLATLDNPATQRFSGEIETLRGLLPPIEQHQVIATHLDGFVGRQWLRDRLDAWRRGASDNRLFWITGKPGTGKSAFSAWLAHHNHCNVVALRLCDYGSDDRTDPGRILRTLAFQIATRHADYRRHLLDRLQRPMPANPAEQFDWLLAAPLHLCVDGGRRDDRLVIVIDALDETIIAGRSDLASILAARARYLPPWVTLVVTGRPDDPLRQLFQGQKTEWIDAASGGNQADLRVYAQAWLGADGPLDRVVAAADGNFLYLRLLHSALSERVFTPADLDRLPAGLGGIYFRWFDRQFRDPAAYQAETCRLLGVIAAASLPVPDDALARIFRWRPLELTRALRPMGSLIERRSTGVALFHKSVRDWLVDEAAAGQFAVDVADGRDLLRPALWAELANGPGEQLSALAQADLPGLLADWPDDVLADALAQAGDLLPVLVRAQTAAEANAASYAWTAAAGWYRLMVRLAKPAGDRALGFQAFAHGMLGGIAETIGDLGGALSGHSAAQTVYHHLAAADPGNTQWQRDLSVSHDRIGDVKRVQSDLDGALSDYRAGLAIRERLAAADPGNAEWQRDLSVSHVNIGDVKRAQGDLDGALSDYRAGLAIGERLAAADPGNAEWQRDLSVSHDNIGDVKEAQGDLDGALADYRAGLTIRERLAAADPGNAEWQRDLSVSHNKIGDVKWAQGDLDGALAGYRAGLSIRERLAAADPGNAGWQRDLIVSLVKIAEASPPDAAPALQRALAVAVQLQATGRLAPRDAWMPDALRRLLAAASSPAPGSAPP